MMETILTWFISQYDSVMASYSLFVSWFSEFSQASPVAAGLIGLWALTVGTFFLRTVPNKLYQFAIRHLTVTVQLHNNEMPFWWFTAWYERTERDRSSRTLTVNRVWDEELDDSVVVMSAGAGIHWFWFKHRLFMMTRIEKETATLGKEVKETLTLQTIGRSQKVFRRLIEEITPPANRVEEMRIFSWENSYWNSASGQHPRPLSTVIIPTKTQRSVVGHIENFYNDKDWCLENGIPHRTGILIYGPPGTGKTSLVRGLCTHFNRPLYYLSLSGMNDAAFHKAFALLPYNSIILIEDIDTHNVAIGREPSDEKTSATSSPTGTMNSDSQALVESLGGITLSGLLNTIDGPGSADGRILIATTNFPERLDEALIREGRFDLHVPLDYMNEETVRAFMARFFPTYQLPQTFEVVPKLTPARLQHLVWTNRDDPEVIMDEVLVK